MSVPLKNLRVISENTAEGTFAVEVCPAHGKKKSAVEKADGRCWWVPSALVPEFMVQSYRKSSQITKELLAGPPTAALTSKFEEVQEAKETKTIDDVRVVGFTEEEDENEDEGDDEEDEGEDQEEEEEEDVKTMPVKMDGLNMEAFKFAPKKEDGPEEEPGFPDRLPGKEEEDYDGDEDEPLSIGDTNCPLEPGVGQTGYWMAQIDPKTETITALVRKLNVAGETMGRDIIVSRNRNHIYIRRTQETADARAAAAKAVKESTDAEMKDFIEEKKEDQKAEPIEVVSTIRRVLTIPRACDVSKFSYTVFNGMITFHCPIMADVEVAVAPADS